MREEGIYPENRMNPMWKGMRRHKDRHLNPEGAGIIRTAKPQICDGCGRKIPMWSWVIRWNCWDRGRKIRVRFCKDCEEVIYRCKKHGRVYVYNDGVAKKLLVANLCRSCPGYLSCEKAEYLRTMNPDDTWWGGLDAPRD